MQSGSTNHTLRSTEAASCVAPSDNTEAPKTSLPPYSQVRFVRSNKNQAKFDAGVFYRASLKTLRTRTQLATKADTPDGKSRLKFSITAGDVQSFHADKRNNLATIQAARRF